MGYKKTVFFVPVWVESFKAAVNAFKKSKDWRQAEPIRPSYLFNYVNRIAESEELFIAFDLNYIPDIFMHEDEFNGKPPIITAVRFSCFDTGAAFLEFHVDYGNATLNEMADFAYLFKKATRASGKVIPKDKISLYDCAATVIPKNARARIFFTGQAYFKHECLCYHMALLDEMQADTRKQVMLLRRNYSGSFTNQSAESQYDMFYEPYPYELWAGSTEGFVNVTAKTGDHNTDFFLENFKCNHLSVDFYFLYLMLLNQRFSAIQYIYEISKAADASPRQLEQLNRRIVRLQTVFAFKTVSDDSIFQNVYSKMYATLDIDRLLEDIKDNESQMEQIRSASAAKAEKLSSKFLFGISLLSLFSALTDATEFFDKLGLPISPTLVGTVCIIAVVAVSGVWMLVTHNK